MISFGGPIPGDYEQFSNFVKCEIEMGGISYPTTEHAFQAYKSKNDDIRKHIAGLRTPGQSKRAGRSVPLRSDWLKVKFGIMVECLRLKFAQEPFKSLLLGTGDELIVEDARQWDDTEWGLGKSGKGRNKLGKALMMVRTELRGLTTIATSAIEMDGVVYTGLRHGDVMDAIVKATNCKLVTGEEGFVTSEGEFLDRTDAQALARSTGQFVGKVIGGPLTSEDLW